MLQSEEVSDRMIQMEDKTFQKVILEIQQGKWGREEADSIAQKNKHTDMVYYCMPACLKLEISPISKESFLFLLDLGCVCA